MGGCLGRHRAVASPAHGKPRVPAPVLARSTCMQPTSTCPCQPSPSRPSSPERLSHAAPARFRTRCARLSAEWDPRPLTARSGDDRCARPLAASRSTAAHTDPPHTLFCTPAANSRPWHPQSIHGSGNGLDTLQRQDVVQGRGHPPLADAPPSQTANTTFTLAGAAEENLTPSTPPRHPVK